MKRKNLFLAIFSLILTLIGIITVSYAWVVNSVNLPSLHVTTSGVKYNYNITSGVNNLTGSVDDISFFDITDSNETEYFLDMAKVVTINLRNTGDIKMNYSISQENINTNNPYVLLFFSNSLLTSNDLDGLTLQSFYQNHNSLTGTINKFDSLNTNDNVTFYVYIIGVVPGNPTNNNFLNSNYSFTIKTEGVGVND